MKSERTLIAVLVGGAVAAVGATVAVAALAVDRDGDGAQAAKEPAAERMVLEDAYGACDHGPGSDRISLADDGHSIIVSAPDSQPFDALVCVMGELGTSEAIVAQIETTTSVMGRQSAEQDGINYAWSYHPDNGLNMTIADR